LKAPSLIRLGFLAVLPESRLLGAIGTLAPERHRRLLDRLINAAAMALSWAAERRVSDAAVPVGVEHWDLGPGEAQVIAHGLAGSRWVVLDDLAY